MGFNVEAIELRQGERTMYVGMKTLGEFNDLLPVRPESEYDVITDVNRAIDRRHVQKLVDYMKRREDWYLPSITLRGHTDGVSFRDGILAVDGDVDILDGQHRRLAIRERIRHL